MTKYTATDRNGTVHKRTSHRTYTHAIVFHFPARPAEDGWAARPASSKTSWAGSLALAQKAAQANIYGAATSEIVEARS